MKKLIFILIALFLVSGCISGNTVAEAPLDVQENQIIVLTDRDYFPVVVEALNLAEESIHVAQFETKYYTSEGYKDSDANQLIEALMVAAERGVEVKVVVDEYAEENVNHAINLMRARGVIAKFDSTKTTLHTKLIIIDNKIVIIGSTNWSHFALDRNHEASVLIYSEENAEELEEYFQMIWEES